MTYIDKFGTKQIEQVTFQLFKELSIGKVTQNKRKMAREAILSIGSMTQERLV